MITASVEDTAAGRWVVLECQHPVDSGRHLILGGKTSAKLLSACGEKFPIGPFTEPADLADRIEKHVWSHETRGNSAGDPAAEDQGPGPGDAAADDGGMEG